MTPTWATRPLRVALAAFAACTSPEPFASSAPASRSRLTAAEPSRSSERAPAEPKAASRATSAVYGWTASAGALDAVDTLRERFGAPSGFELDRGDSDSLVAWLVGLPLAAVGTPVRSYRGEVVLAANDPRLAAVSTLDVGDHDLQQCADAVIRLYAEHAFVTSRDEELVFRAVSGDEMPFARWLAGERLTLRGEHLRWASGGAPRARSHASLRSWLDRVFEYASTLSLRRDSRAIARSELRAGDFFVQGGSPGHAVMVLATARDRAGRVRALLGQSYMPAQSFHVLAHEGEPWFDLDQDVVSTPFWRPFEWSDLRRMP